MQKHEKWPKLTKRPKNHKNRPIFGKNSQKVADFCGFYGVLGLGALPHPAQRGVFLRFFVHPLGDKPSVPVFMKEGVDCECNEQDGAVVIKK